MKTNNPIKRGVSLYSYQEAIWRGDLDLEGALTAVAGSGAEGVEIFGEALIREFPNISDEFLYKWFYNLNHLKLEPLCYEHFADRCLYKNRIMDDDYVYNISVQYIKSAAKLGCKFIRLSHTGHNGASSQARALTDPSHATVNEKVCERLLPICAEYDVTMALEVHAPGYLDDGGNDGFLEVVERTGLPYAKLMLDLSGCLRSGYPNNRKSLVENEGANMDCLLLVDSYRSKAFTYKTTDDGVQEVDWEEMFARLKEMGANDVDMQYAKRAQMMRSTPPKVLKQYASQLCYVHGKVNWVNEDYTSDEMDYPILIKALQEGGYKGYISTELEGQRVLAHTVNEVEQVRRHQQLLKNCLGYGI